MDKNFLSKLIAVQTELKAPKSQFNKFGGYAYRNCEDILEAVKPLLRQYGLSLVITDSVVMVGERFYLKATATIFDENGSMTNEALAREEDTKKGMDGSQVTGSASSYARKYALNGLLCIDDNKDADFTQKPESKPAKPLKEVSREPNILTEAIKEVASAKSEEELKAVVEKYRANLGKNVQFVKVVKLSPYCPK